MFLAFKSCFKNNNIKISEVGSGFLHNNYSLLDVYDEWLCISSEPAHFRASCVSLCVCLCLCVCVCALPRTCDTSVPDNKQTKSISLLHPPGLPCRPIMRVILVKPTNATRRLDSTGEVLNDGERERLTSEATPPPAQPSEGECRQHSEASCPSEESSLCCAFPPLRGKSNGICPVGVSDGRPPPKSRNLTLSEMSDRDWLLLYSQVSVGGEVPSSPQSSGSCVGQPNSNERCLCSCPHDRQQPEAPSLRSKGDSVRDRLSNLAKRTSLSSSPYSQVSPQSSQISNSHRVLVQEPAATYPCENLLQPCNHYKLKESGHPAIFNIPLDSTDLTQKTREDPRPAAAADFNWTELFGTEPILVKQRPKQDSRDPPCRASKDPSIILNCRRLPHNPLTTAQRKPSPPASDRSVQSLSSSQYSSLQNQDLLEEIKRQCKVSIEHQCRI